MDIRGAWVLCNNDEMGRWHHGCFATSCLEQAIWHHSSFPFTCSSTTIFIFYCWAINNHKFSDLKQHTFIILLFPWVMRLQTRCWPGCILLWNSTGEEIIQIFVRIHFLVAVWPSVTAFCWPQVLELPHSCWGCPSFFGTWTSSTQPLSLSSQQEELLAPVC